jgi:glycosyltransferase involved in cell wall biosynthesis
VISERGVITDDSPRRVLHVMWRMTIGGAERSVFQLVREQRARGIAADVLVGKELGLYGRRLERMGVCTYELRCRHAIDVSRAFRARRIAKDYRVVHFHGLEPVLMAAMSGTKGPRFVYTHRGGARHGRSLTKRLRVNFSRRRVQRFSAASGNTRHSAQVLASLLGLDEREIPVTYNGLDFSLLTPERSRDDVLGELPPHARGQILIGTASNLQRCKRVHLLLEAITRLGELPLHCVVIGDGPERSELEHQTEVLRLRERVTFLGRKEHVGDYLQVLDLFVLPSGPEEAFGNAAVEAMGTGVPTIVFADGGGLIEHIAHRQTGIVVQDVGELVASVRELLENEELRGHLAEEGRRYVHSKYSLNAMFQGYETLYEQALTRS